jgi:hypothetical protein
MGLLAGALLLGGSALFAACSSDSNKKATPTAAPTTAVASASAATGSSTPGASSTAATATSSASTAPAVSPTPNAAAQKLAETAGYFLYTTREGDTSIILAQLFNGEPGSAKAGYPQQILDVNNIKTDSLTANQQIAIPLLATPGDIIPSQGLANALKTKMNPKIVVYEPSTTFLGTFKDAVALHSVQLGANDANGGGYRMEYWLTDGPALVNGAVNPDVKVTTPAFVVSAGDLVPPEGATGDIARYTHDGMNYAVTALDGAGQSSIGLVAGMQIVLAKGP